MSVDEAVRALQAGGLAVLPTDTVYGLCSAADEQPTRRLYALKGRPATQPTALVLRGLDALLDALPELRGGAGEASARALLPGPYTLVLPNPARRFPWLAGTDPDALGVRVPDFTGPGKEVLDRLGAIVATSANLPGGADPRRLEDVPAELRDSAAALLDGGELPGTPSTVLDLTGPAPRVLREGAAPSADALAAVLRSGE